MVQDEHVALDHCFANLAGIQSMNDQLKGTVQAAKGKNN
jgi:hypothetical protein